MSSIIPLILAEIAARPEKAIKRFTPHRILIKSSGRFLTTNSKKTVWNTIGHAKAALRNDLENMRSIRKLPHNERKAAVQEFLENEVEFIAI